MSLRIGIGVGMIPQQARPVPTTAPANRPGEAPTITGILTQGQALTANPGGWDGLPSGEFAYQWQRSGSSIVGATNSTYVAQAADVAAGASAITVEVTATNTIGSTMAESAGVTIAGPLTISGTVNDATVGTPYTYTPTSTGGHTPKTYALTGTLPAGLSFNTSTGAITGTPESSGTASGLNITVTDADGLTASLGTFSLTVTGAVSSTITMTRDAWIWGSSSSQGNQDGTGVTLFTRLSANVDAARTNGTESANSRTYNVSTVSNGKKFHNRGISGESYSQIAARSDVEAAALGSTDFTVLHIGDNAVSTTTTAVAGLSDVYNAMQDMKADVNVTSRPFVLAVNTRGGINVATTNYGEGPHSPFYGAKDYWFRKYSADNPGRVIDFFHTLLDHANDYGLQDATNDQADIDKFTSPRGFMLADGSHMNQHGYNVVADYALTPMVDAIEGGTPFPLRQFIAATSPTTPAIGDTIGTIVAYGSGGSFELDSSNTQSDYVVSAGGVITRNTAIIPARDFTQVKVRTTKTGRPARVQPNIWVGEYAKSGESKLIEFDGYSTLFMPFSSVFPSGVTTLTMVFRIQATANGMLNAAAGTANRVMNGVQMQTTGGMNVTFPVRASDSQSLLNVDFAAGTFHANAGAGSPNAARWVMASLDIPNGLAKLSHFTDPAGTITSPANSGSANTRLLADPAATLNLPNQNWMFGYNLYPMSKAVFGTRVASFRLGDFWMGPGYFDPTVKANRNLFVDDGGAPAAALLATSDGVVSGNAPLLYCRGRAADWRMARFIGTDKFGFNSWKNPGTGERGYLASV